ncbi:MAG: ABC transporter ATP-binding protein [Deltaproteobacteria bacterium]|nr:ABC transporter ATP-binding protein [Deltaproteobacteria bacterium]
MFGKLKTYPFWELVKRHRRQYVLGLVTLILVDVINVVLPLLIRSGLDAIPTRQMNIVWASAAGILLLMSGQSIGRFMWRVYLMGASNEIARDLRRDLYSHLQRMPLKYYQSVKTGDLMSRATNDVEAVRMAVGPGILVALDAVIMFVLIIPVMIVLSPRLTLYAFAFYPIAPFLTRWLGGKIEVLFDTLQTKLSSLSSYAQESFGAIRLIKSLVLESTAARRFSELSETYAITGERLARYEAIFSPALGLMTNMGTFLILLMGGKSVVEGALTLGTFVAFQRFVVQLSWPMEAIGWATTMQQEGKAALSRLRSVMDIAPVTDSQVKRMGRGDHDLLVEKLKFGYGGQFDLELQGLRAAGGKKIGIVGPVGSGKTTLFNLLLRLYEPPPGAVFVGGEDVIHIPRAELRGVIASVEQQVFLFSETIESNVSMGMASAPSTEVIRQFIQSAGVWDEVVGLNDGVSSVLGERGVNLSGGQKSRLALARALVRQSPILILDDCFSSVDVEVERRIIQNLFRVAKNTTVLIASHRLSIMPLVDEIWVLDNGRLNARGTHRELLESNSLYQSLWHRASSSSRWEETGQTL